MWYLIQNNESTTAGKEPLLKSTRGLGYMKCYSSRREILEYANHLCFALSAFLDTLYLGSIWIHFRPMKMMDESFPREKKNGIDLKTEQIDVRECKKAGKTKIHWENITPSNWRNIDDCNCVAV